MKYWPWACILQQPEAVVRVHATASLIATRPERAFIHVWENFSVWWSYSRKEMLRAQLRNWCGSRYFERLGIFSTNEMGLLISLEGMNGSRYKRISFHMHEMSRLTTGFFNMIMARNILPMYGNAGWRETWALKTWPEIFVHAEFHFFFSLIIYHTFVSHVAESRQFPIFKSYSHWRSDQNFLPATMPSPAPFLL